MVLAGMLLSMSAIMVLVFTAGYATDSNSILVCGLFFVVAVGFAIFVKPQIVQVVMNVYPFTKTSAFLTLEPFIFCGN